MVEERLKTNIVEFYRGERGNNNGIMIDEIMTWTDGQLEMDHDYIQWIFPSNEPSMLNGDAPVMTREQSEVFQADPELQEKVKQAFIKFLGFLRFQLVQDDDQVVIEAAEESPWWTRRFNHTMLRVTRMIKSLRLTGLEKYALAFWEAVQPFKPVLSENTWNYWHDAALADLWAEDYSALVKLRERLAPCEMHDNTDIDPDLL